MRHSYDTDAIFKAMVEASNEYPGIRGMISAPFEAFLEALPEPDQQDDWQECTIDQIRRGDKVRWQEPGIEDTCIYEIIALQTTPEDPGWLLYSRTESYYFPPGAVVDRIPAPIVTPDPVNHPVILIREAVVKHDPPVVAIAMRERVGNELIYVFGEYGALPPRKITDWSPAKVVADND